MTRSLLAALVAALAGCASYDGRGLVPGSSTAADVEAVMGPPADRVAVGGETVLFYPRGPYGPETFAVRIGPDGRMVAIEQRLTVENIGKLVLGQSTAKDVRELFGPPRRIGRLPMQQRDVWEYLMYNPVQVEHILSVQFSADGLVREAFMIRHPKYDQGSPGGWH